MLIYPYQNITVRTLRFSDVVMILRRHERDCLALQFLWSRFGLGHGVGLGWIFGRNGTHDFLSPLMLCNLGGGVVLVRPCVELLYLPVLQFALQCRIVMANAPEMLKPTYYLRVVVIRGSKSSDGLRVIRQRMIFVRGQI